MNARRTAQVVKALNKTAECRNCGETAPMFVAFDPPVRELDALAMCKPCWIAEIDYMRAHFTDEEIEGIVNEDEDERA